MLPARKEMVHTTRVLSNSPLQNDSPKSFKKRGFHKYQTLLTCLFLREVMPKAARVLASTNPRMKCQHSSGSSKDTSILGLAGRRKEKGLATSFVRVTSSSTSAPAQHPATTLKLARWRCRKSKPFMEEKKRPDKEDNNYERCHITQEEKSYKCNTSTCRFYHLRP